jgi:prevent-host-death family protein
LKRRVTAFDARGRFDELLESVQSRGDEVVIERSGKAMAVVIPAERYEAMERSRGQMWQFVETAQAGHDELTDYEVNELVQAALAEVRR